MHRRHALVPMGYHAPGSREANLTPPTASEGTRGAGEPLPESLSIHLSALIQEGFPVEPPWQVVRPSWAIDASPNEQRRLTQWLAWFYGFGDPLNPPAAPLAPNLRFTAVGQTIRILIRDGRAKFDPYPSSIVQFSCIRSLAAALCHYQRQRISVLVDRSQRDRTWVDVEAWTRPEFVTLALTRKISRDGRRTKATDLLPGSRGDDDLGGQFGVIPCDLDFAEGDHAPRTDNLRLATRSEGPSVFGWSVLPWGYELPSLGGAYRYLKLAEPIEFSEDPVRARELLQGAQRELTESAKQRGIHVDLAYRGATSLCRVPYSVPTKYAWNGGEVRQLPCPVTDGGAVVDLADLEKYRELVRSPSTRSKIRAHKDRRARLGDGVPPALARNLEVKWKAVSYGRIYILRICPICGCDKYTAHLNEWDWRLTCKRATCAAANGVQHEDWLKRLHDVTRHDLRALILNETALSRIAEHPPLELEGMRAQLVPDHQAGMRAIRAILINAHGIGMATSKEAQSAGTLLLLGADCGAGKSYGAQEASSQVAIAYSAPQYTLLDEFRGCRPYQIQGMAKGCLIEGLGVCAIARGVSRRYLCSKADDPCPYLSRCPAQPRIQTGGTPTFVHAATATIRFGATLKDGLVLSGDDAGEDIARDSLFVVDEAPDLFEETVCAEKELEEALRLKNLSNVTSRVRNGFLESDDARCRIFFILRVIGRLKERMRAEALRLSADYSTTWTDSRVADVIIELMDEVERDESFYGVRHLFRLGNVQDLTKPGGVRPCIPEQREWTTHERPIRRRTPEHVNGLIPRSIVALCRAVAAALEHTGSKATRLVATLDDRVTLKVLKTKDLFLPGSVGTVIMSAGIELVARLLPAVHPRVQLQVESVRLVPQSKITRVLFATSAFNRASANRAFEQDRYSVERGQMELSPIELNAKEMRRRDVLGSLHRVLCEAAQVVERERARAGVNAGSLDTLLVTHSSIVSWLVSTTEGATWLQDHTPPQLALVRGDPWSSEPSQWGSIVYFGGRGRGENLWSSCRVGITLGDPLPNIGDMEARFGDKTDPQTGEFFDAAEVAIWHSQEAVMQAHGRTRPGRAGLPTILLHAGCYAPMGFGPDDEVVVAESTRVEARRAFTLGRITRALESKEVLNAARSRPLSVARVARAAELDPKTVARHLRRSARQDAGGQASAAASSGISHTYILIGEIPELAAAVSSLAGAMRAAIQGGAAIPKATGAVRTLESVGLPLVFPRSTLRRHLMHVRKDLEGSGDLTLPLRVDARVGRLAAIVACLSYLGLSDELHSLQALLERSKPSAEPTCDDGRRLESGPNPDGVESGRSRP